MLYNKSHLKPLVNTILVVAVFLSSSLFFSPVLAGEYDNLIPQAAKGRNLYPEIEFRFEYDDNINTEEEIKNASVKYRITPQMTLSLPAPSSILLMSYRLGYTFFEDATDDVDISHYVNLTANHRFSSSFEGTLKNSFRRFQEPEESFVLVDEEGTILTDDLGQIRTTVTKRSDDFDQNTFEASFEYLVTKRIFTNLEYTNYFIDYDDTETGESINRTSNTVVVSANYYLSFNPRQGKNYPNVLALGYQFSENNYDIAEKDSKSDVLYAQYSHWFDPRLRLSVVGGWERRKFDESDTIVNHSQDEPYTNISLSSQFSRQLSASLSYGLRISETQEDLFASRVSQLISFGLNQRLSQRSSFQLNGSYDLGTYNVDQLLVAATEDLLEEFRQDHLEQNVLQLEMTLRRRLSERLTALAGWRFTEVDSDFPSDSYTRNRYYVGVRGLF